MSRRFIAAHDSLSKDAVRWLIAHDFGIAKPVQRGLVAIGGKARQFWPPALSTAPVIEWTTETLWAIAYEWLTNQPAIARLDFDPDGTYTYTNDTGPDDPVTEGPFTWLGVEVSASEQYIIKAELQFGPDDWSGDDAFGTWHDASSAIVFGLENTAQGNLDMRLNVHVAAVDPAQLPTLAPLAGSEVIKVCDFTAAVLDDGGDPGDPDPNDIGWGQSAWVVAETKESADATCELSFDPDGTAFAHGDDTGTFSGNWHASPPPADPVNFTVTVTKNSGDDPSGPTLGVAHDLNSPRQWILTSGEGDGEQTCDLDVVVSDGVDSVTRNVVMTSERTDTETESEVAWTETEQSATAFSPLATSGDAVASLIMANTGVGSGTATPLAGSSEFTEDWHDDAPAAANPEEYEVKVDVVSGDGPTTGPATGAWLSLGTTRTWTLEADQAQVEFFQGWWDVTVRQIGNAASAVTKRVFMQAVSETGA